MSTQSSISSKGGARDSSRPQKKALTIPEFRARKKQEPLVCLTAYTAHVAYLISQECDLILVGDSLGMVIHGMENTLGVTLEHMIMHGAAVRRGAKEALVVVDMPFGSFEESPETAFRHAARIVKETGCNAVKLEGGADMGETIQYLTTRGMPVMAHIGLMPQQLNKTGGFKAVRRKDHFEAVIADALAVERAGAFAIVVEGVAEDLAREITSRVEVPTIGIGASASCDGQILVFEDMVGLFPRVPSFVKRYGNMEDMMKSAIQTYAREVRARDFPSEDHVYHSKET